MKKEDNELVTRVGPGTAMGGLMRQFWIPALLSDDLKVDQHPTRIRLLGEDLLALRDTSGKIGIISPLCPHRGAPLYYGRNEEGGIRCIYHGWKFDVEGNCVDMPTDPNGEALARRTKLKVYLARERNGIVWVYMGQPEEAPELPAFEWNEQPPERRYFSLRIQECNWLQVLEGAIDSAHASVLHSRLQGDGASVLSRSTLLSSIKHPTIEAMDTDYGVAIAALRKVEQLCYWRITHFLFPFYTLIPPFEGSLTGQAWIPIDDENTLCLMYSFDPTRAIDEKSRDIYANGYRGRESGHPSANGLKRRIGQPYENYWPAYSRDNDFGIDWEDQRTKRFSGLPGLWVQDAGCQSGIEPILDRSEEKLGPTDVGIVRVRRKLLQAAQAYEKSREVPGVARDPLKFDVRAVAMHLKPGEQWNGDLENVIRTEGAVDYSTPPEG